MKFPGRKFSLILLIHLGILFGCGCLDQAHRNEEAKVFGSYINSEYNLDQLQQIVIIRSTTGIRQERRKDVAEDIVHRFKDSPVEVNIDIANEFVSRNARSSQVIRPTGVIVDVEFLSERRFQKYFSCERKSSESWKSFYKDYANSQGIMRLSRVGFNQDRTLALFYCSNSWAGLGGEDHYVFMQKRLKKWFLVTKKQISIS